MQVAIEDTNFELDSIAIEWMQLNKCNTSLKLFQAEVENETVEIEQNKKLRVLGEFKKYLRDQENKNHDDDLGFEINFGTFQKEPKFPVSQQLKPKPKVCSAGPEGKKTTGKPLPKTFLETIKKLGLREQDAETLYSTKINWTAVFSDNKIFCPERGCDFSTEISKDNAELQAHMENVHQWGDFPCTAKNCFYICYSKTNRNRHNKMHKIRSEKQFPYKCGMVPCQSSFNSMEKLKLHLRTHNNDYDECQFCSYRYFDPYNYKTHLSNHFRVKELKCDVCGKEFVRASQLNQHYSLHEGINYFCLLCNAYSATHKTTFSTHLKRKHAEIVGPNVNWESVQKYIRKQ